MDLRESITNQTNVSLSIANHLFSKQSQQHKNTLFSPLSLQVALSIIAAGSEGPTLQQLLDFLRFKSTDHLNSFVSDLLSVILKDTPSHQPWLPFLGDQYTTPTTPAFLSFANGVWVEQSLTLQTSFKQIVATDYKATLASVDFQNKAVEVTNEVNLWVEKETNGLIKEILPQGSVHHLTRLIFANALYFKGAWDYPFFVSETKDYDFHLLNGSSVKVPFMTSKKDQFIRAFDGFKVLRIPYKQGDERKFSMYFFLPNAKDGLPDLVEKVASESEFLDHKLPLDKVEVGDFRIPRFNISFELETSDILKELGVILPFYEGGLTKLVYSKVSEELQVSEIFHKSFIKVNEKGTEAAAATVVTVEAQCARIKIVPTRLDFVADHPFLFMIREDLTGTILFIGWVLHPLIE